jgi:hypothetical protein
MDRMDVSTANFDIIRHPGGAYAHFSAAWGEAEQGSGQGGRVGRRRAKEVGRGAPGAYAVFS